MSRAWVTLARLLRPQGRKGELLAELTTNFPEKFASRQQVFLCAPGLVTTATPLPREAMLEAHWFPVGKNAGRIVLKFAGCDSISEAEAIAGSDVLIPLEERTALEQDEVYISDLTGCELWDGDHLVGTIEDAQAAGEGESAAEGVPLLVVKSLDGEELLVPFAKAWLQRVDTAARKVEMKLPEGLLDLNRNEKA